MRRGPVGRPAPERAAPAPRRGAPAPLLWLRFAAAALLFCLSRASDVGAPIPVVDLAPGLTEVYRDGSTVIAHDLWFHAGRIYAIEATDVGGAAPRATQGAAGLPELPDYSPSDSDDWRAIAQSLAVLRINVRDPRRFFAGLNASTLEGTLLWLEHPSRDEPLDALTWLELVAPLSSSLRRRAAGELRGLGAGEGPWWLADAPGRPRTWPDRGRPSRPRPLAGERGAEFAVLANLGREDTKAASLGRDLLLIALRATEKPDRGAAEGGAAASGAADAATAAPAVRPAPLPAPEVLFLDDLVGRAPANAWLRLPRVVRLAADPREVSRREPEDNGDVTGRLCIDAEQLTQRTNGTCATYGDGGRRRELPCRFPPLWGGAADALDLFGRARKAYNIALYDAIESARRRADAKKAAERDLTHAAAASEKSLADAPPAAAASEKSLADAPPAAAASEKSLADAPPAAAASEKSLADAPPPAAASEKSLADAPPAAAASEKSLADAPPAARPLTATLVMGLGHGGELANPAPLLRALRTVAARHGAVVRPWSPSPEAPLASVLAIGAKTDVLVGRSGPTLAAALALRPGSAVLELLPRVLPSHGAARRLGRLLRDADAPVHHVAVRTGLGGLSDDPTGKRRFPPPPRPAPAKRRGARAQQSDAAPASATPDVSPAEPEAANASFPLFPPGSKLDTPTEMFLNEADARYAPWIGAECVKSKCQEAYARAALRVDVGRVAEAFEAVIADAARRRREGRELLPPDGSADADAAPKRFPGTSLPEVDGRPTLPARAARALQATELYRQDGQELVVNGTGLWWDRW